MSERDADDPVAMALQEAAAGVPGAAERFWKLRSARIHARREFERSAHRHARAVIARTANNLGESNQHHQAGV